MSWGLVDVRSLAWVAVVLAGCASAPIQASGPEPASPVVPPLYVQLEGEAEAEPERRIEPALPRAIAALDAAGFKDASVRKGDAAKATAHGLSTSLAIEALEEIAEACPDPKDKECGGNPEAFETKWKLVQWLGFAGDETAAGALLRLRSDGGYRAGMALDSLLARRAEARATPCTSPGTEAVAEMAASLNDFAVFDQRGQALVARPLTVSESADLAYFLVAVEQAGTPVGTDDNSFASGAQPSAEFDLDRKENYTGLERALADGDTEAIVGSGVAYLQPLGFPGKIDRSLDGDRSWGGARYSYVMRDVALAAEVEGQYTLSSALYRRANPGGGGCGTSVSSRRGKQLKGLIRSAEAGGSCNEVVAERLLDWDGRDDSFFGPDRLAAAGLDVARLYRGAFLTRHRDLPEAQLSDALDRAPEAFAFAARARIESKGDEAWDARIWSIEGLADTLGSEGGFYLAAALPELAPSARRRAIEAIGAAGLRAHVGACDEESFWGLGMGFSTLWSRPIAAFGKTCELAYSDADVATLYRSVRPNMRSASAEVRNATVQMASALGALTAVGDIRKLHARHRRAAKACKPSDQNRCYAEENALGSTREALETLKQHRTALRARTQ